MMDDETNGDDLARAVAESMEMDETADYLRRGRRFAALPDQDAKKAWAKAFKAWIEETSSPERQKLAADLAAELRLRLIAPPTELVPEMRTIGARLAANTAQLMRRGGLWVI
jgi:hypothetical protein